MRDEQPVYRNERYDFWALSRHDDIAAVHRDHVTFTSSRGTVLELMGTELGDRGSIIFKDPPIHTILRSLVSRAFTPRRMAAMEDTVRGICVDLLDPYVGSQVSTTCRSSVPSCRRRNLRRSSGFRRRSAKRSAS